MEQKITIKIAGRTYSIKADSPDKEEMIRKAAAEVNRIFDEYITRYPGRGASDILAFVALNMEMGNISLRRELMKAQRETRELDHEIEAYLKKTDKNSR